MTNAAAYLRHITALGGVPPQFHQIGGSDPPIITAAFVDSPDEGMTTAFTYGLSLSEHPNWEQARPELMVCVASLRPEWATIAGVVAAGMKGNSAFHYGATFDAGRPIAPDTAMTAFLLFGPLILDRELATVRLSGYDVRITQLYPIYEGEVKLIHRIGVEKFLGDERLNFVNPARQELLVD